MYDIISDVIGHTWQSNYTGEQSYVYTVCCVLCVVIIVHFADFCRWLLDIVRGK